MLKTDLRVFYYIESAYNWGCSAIQFEISGHSIRRKAEVVGASPKVEIPEHLKPILKRKKNNQSEVIEPINEIVDDDLSSACGVDYTLLRNLLQASKWLEFRLSNKKRPSNALVEKKQASGMKIDNLKQTLVVLCGV